MLVIIKEYLPKTELLKTSIQRYLYIYGTEKEVPYVAFPNTTKSLLVGIDTTLKYANGILTATPKTGDLTIVLLDNLVSNTCYFSTKSIILQIDFYCLGFCNFNSKSTLVNILKKERFIPESKDFKINNDRQTEEVLLRNIECIFSNNYKKQETEELANAIQLIEASYNIKKAVSEVNMSYRTLHRHFKKYLGMTPSMYQRIFRLKNVLLTNENALKAFYDESHFIREFKFFTGYTPNKYRKSSEENIADFYYKMK